jgi:hypothetical protein
MLEAIVHGEQDSQRLAEMSHGKLRNKIPELQRALQGRVTAHHRFLLRELLDHLCLWSPRCGGALGELGGTLSGLSRKRR